MSNLASYGIFLYNESFDLIIEIFKNFEMQTEKTLKSTKRTFEESSQNKKDLYHANCEAVSLLF